MRRISTLAIIGAAAAMAFVSCKKQAQDKGTLSIAINSDFYIADVTKSQVSDYAELPLVGDFTLTLKNDKSQIFKGLVSAWDNTAELSAGQYTATVEYGSAEDEGPQKPYFSGTGNFQIAGGEHTTANLEAKLANAIIRFETSEMFKNYFPSYSFKVTTGAQHEFSFDATHTDPIFVDAYKITLSGTMTNQGGTQISFGPKDYTDLEPSTCYTLKFDVSTVGGVKVEISFNDTLTTVDLGDIELN